MNTDATPAKVRLTDGLGPLPEPAYFADGTVGMMGEHTYTADQMRAYALQERAAEREWCAAMLDRGIDLVGLNEHPGWQKYTADLLAACADLIRKA